VVTELADAKYAALEPKLTSIINRYNLGRI